MLDLEYKHTLFIAITEEDQLYFEADVKEEKSVPSELIALEMVKELLVNIAEKCHVKPEFLAEVMYHDFTNGEYLTGGNYRGKEHD